MLYVYDLATGIHLGWTDEASRRGVDATDQAPPTPTAITIGRWTGIAWESAPRPELAAQRQAQAEELVQARLDTLAAAWGYDDMRSLISYQASSVPRFAAQAAAGLAYRDALWLATIAYGAAHPTDGDAAGLLAALPAAPGNPTP